ncbi:hypothetical protein ACWDTQ_12525, partial [Streptomyces cellulosae]
DTRAPGLPNFTPPNENGPPTPSADRHARSRLAVVMCFFWAAGYLWDKLADDDAKEVEPTGVNPLEMSVTASVQLAVTIQGVVLGLIFAFLDKDAITITVQVGVVALAVGVLSGILLFTYVSHHIFGYRTQAFVIILQDLTLWGLAYGLLCITSTVVAI